MRFYPDERYADFRSLRGDLEREFSHHSSEHIEVMPLHDDTVEDLVRKGNNLNEIGQPQAAIAYFEAAIQRGGDKKYIAWAWMLRGLSHSELDQRAQSIACYQEALKIWPNYDNAMNNLSIQLMRDKRLGEALAMIDQAITLKPNNSIYIHTKGYILDDMNRKEEALALFEHSITINPRDADAWNSKGVVLRNLGRSREALECFNKALQLNPHNEMYLHNKQKVEPKP